MKPSVRALLAALEEAGPAGMAAGDLARQFDEPEDIQRRLSWAGNELRRYRDRGYVTRSPRTEPSAYYNNTPAFRWFITPEGSAYLAGGMYEGRVARTRDAAARKEQEREARKLRQEQLLREAAAAWSPVTCPCARDAEIRHLNAEGCLRDATGAVYGLTRERIRQIAAGINVSSCWLPGHDYEKTACSHGIVTPAGPEMARRRIRRTA